MDNENKTSEIKVEEEKKVEEQLEDIVTGTEVMAASDKGIDYAKLMDKFGC
jgi:hypothetical protein